MYLRSEHGWLFKVISFGRHIVALIKFKKFEKPDEKGNVGPRIERYTPFMHWFFHCLYMIAVMPDRDTPNEIVITSLNDSLHTAKSRHYNDEAADIRSKNFPTRDSKLHFAGRLTAMLNCHPEDPAKFIVILENEGSPEEHFHVQIKKGHSFLGN